jgi:hypothetical protein
VGSIAKPRGCFSAGELPRYSSLPVAPSTLSAARPLLVRSDIKRNCSSGVVWISAAQIMRSDVPSQAQRTR